MSKDVTFSDQRSDQEDHSLVRTGTEEILGKLRAVSREFVATFPKNPKTAGEAAREFGLPRKLVWQLYRMSGSEDLLGMLPFVPGTRSGRKLVNAAVAAGASSVLGLKLEGLLARFDEFVNVHAGDRDMLLTIIGQHASGSGDGSDHDRKHRVLIYKSYLHFYGISVDTVSELTIVSESATGFRESVDWRSVSGLRRLRADSINVYDRLRRTGRGTSEPGDVQYEPMDPVAFAEHGVPLVGPFTSKPIPQTVVSYDDDPTLMRVDYCNKLAPMSPPVTLSLATISRGQFSVEPTGREQGQRLLTLVGYPARVLRKTYLIHMPHKRLLPPRLKMWVSPMAIMSADDRKELKSYPMQESIRSYPAGSWSSYPDKFGPVREQVAYCCAKMNWDPSDFVIYDFEVEYPLMHSVMQVEVPWIQE